jgi:RNA polymerase sigma factor (sigma-70 family)
MSAARAIPHHHGDGRAVGYDSDKFISDERLVAVAKMGDGTVFEELRRRHAEKMFRVAHRIIRHREDAEDAVQESFLSAYVHLKAFDGRAKFSTWLTRIAINAALMKVRKNRLSREIPLENTAEGLDPCPEYELKDFSPNPEEICEKEEQEAALRDAIAKLRPSLRKSSNFISCRNALCVRPQRYLGSLRQQRRDDCSMDGLHYAGIRPYF